MSIPMLELTKKTYLMYKGWIELSLIVGTDSPELLSQFHKDEGLLNSLISEIDNQLIKVKG